MRIFYTTRNGINCWCVSPDPPTLLWNRVVFVIELASSNPFWTDCSIEISRQIWSNGILYLSSKYPKNLWQVLHKSIWHINLSKTRIFSYSMYHRYIQSNEFRKNHCIVLLRKIVSQNFYRTCRVRWYFWLKIGVDGVISIIKWVDFQKIQFRMLYYH